MNSLNNKGFTLIELIATIILLALVMGVGSYSIIAIINNTKENNYKNLIKEIKNAVEVYYQECRFVNNNCDSDSIITLGYLVTNGYLKGNNDNDIMKLVNPRDNVNITNCQIKFTYSGKINIEDKSGSGSCPVSNDYK